MPKASPQGSEAEEQTEVVKHLLRNEEARWGLCTEMSHVSASQG